MHFMHLVVFVVFSFVCMIPLIYVRKKYSAVFRVVNFFSKERYHYFLVEIKKKLKKIKTLFIKK